MNEEQIPAHVEDSFNRESRGLEFERVAFFSDAIYAIAMTLLVVDIKIPEMGFNDSDPSMVLDTLRRNTPEIIGFFLCFWLIGMTWISHHRFMASLKTIGHTLMTLNMFYLAFVAFMPFPVSLISHYDNNIMAFLIFTGNLVVLNVLELIMFVVAYRLRRTRPTVTREVFDYGVVACLVPIAIFVVSIPVALVHTTYGLVFWFLIFPISAYRRRHAKPEVHRYLHTGG
ncbi:MAG: TMEM175 family protein [Hyphomicrobiales bacterium]